VIDLVIAAYYCGEIAILALIEGHLTAIKEQGQSQQYRPNKAKGCSEPDIMA
jgi:hypothetical protein